jgi:hypothetical protein
MEYIVAEIFAEVIGTLSQSHYKLVKKNFFEKLNELRKDAPTTPATIHAIICLLMGMKFVRIKVLNNNMKWVEI